MSRDEHKLIHFSDRGHEVAERIVARHRTVEAYLVKVMGIPWDDVHEEAHAMEHSISPRLETKMLEMIGEVRTCPHGHPIGDYPREPGESLPAVPAGSEVTVLRLENEAEEILHYMYRAGVEPGRRYTVASRSGEGDDALTELEADDGRASRSRTWWPARSLSAWRSAATGRSRRLPTPRRSSSCSAPTAGGCRAPGTPGAVVGPRMRGRLVVRVAVGHDEHGEPRGGRGEDQPDEPALEDGLEPLHGPQKNRRGAPAWPVRPVAVDRLDWVVAIAVPSTSEGDGGHPNAGCSDSPWVQGFAPTREHLHSPVLSLLTSRTTSFPRSEHRSNAVPRRQASGSTFLRCPRRSSQGSDSAPSSLPRSGRSRCF